MEQTQIIAYGVDERLAGTLQELAHAQGLWMRVVQQPRACRNLLRGGGPAVLIVALGRNLLDELSLVEEVGVTCPDTAVVVVGDTDHPALAALAWDLGARCVLQPPAPVEWLPRAVLRLLTGEEA